MSVIKEIFIILLFTVAIALILGIMFYEYVPFNKHASQAEAYVTSEEIEAELKANVIIFEEANASVSLEVGSGDLEYYEAVYKYIPGKINPFADYSSGAVAGDGSESGTPPSSSTNSGFDVNVDTSVPGVSTPQNKK